MDALAEVFMFFVAAWFILGVLGVVIGSAFMYLFWRSPR